MPYNNDELAHFGVKGMKWGQRRADRRTARANARAINAAAKEKYYQQGRAERAKAADARTKAAKAQLDAASKETGLKGLAAKAAAKSNARDVQILNARLQYIDHKRDYKDAKAQYKIDRVEKGKYEAKQILKKHRETYYDKVSPSMNDTTQELVSGFISNTLKDVDKSSSLRTGW